MSQNALIFDKRPNAKKRLFCFPYAGGSSALYRLWAQQLPSDWELVAVDYPGRIHMKDAPAQDMDALIDALLPPLRALLDRPSVFFGHSFGAAVAYALVRQLQEDGLALPEHLFASARVAPHLPSGQPDIRELDNDTLVQIVEARYGALPAVVKQEPELLKAMLPVLRGDLTVNGPYQVELDTELTIPVTALYSPSDQMVSTDAMQAWKDVTSGEFKLLEFDGGHFFIDTHRDEVIRLLTAT